MVAANASTIFVDSSSLASNNSGLPTYNLTGALAPNPNWAAAFPGSFWISYGSTGYYEDPWYFSPPDGTDVIFSTQFMLSGQITNASMTVLADYSAGVTLNGHALVPAAQMAGSLCPGQQPGCLISAETVYTSAQLVPDLMDGINTLSFEVIQLGGGSFGLDFAATIAEVAFSAGTVQDPTPEPGTLSFLFAGLLAMKALHRCKLKTWQT